MSPRTRRGDSHHLIPWAQGGRTDIDLLGLICEFDHRLPDEGWTVTLNPETATIEWTAPPWIDPTQTPRVNQLRHPTPATGGAPRLGPRADTTRRPGAAPSPTTPGAPQPP